MDLKSPFNFAHRRPLVEDSVFFLPDHCDTPFVLPWRRASVELCSGNGDWIIARALREKEHFFIAVEQRFDRVRKIWAKMKNSRVDNLLIVCGEACCFLERHVPDGGVDDLWINFPDPWPKRRHEKHRLMQKFFVEQLARTVLGQVMVATDDLIYFQRVLALLGAHPAFEGGRKEIAEYGFSYFDALWRKEGREIFYAAYSRRDTSC